MGASVRLPHAAAFALHPIKDGLFAVITPAMVACAPEERHELGALVVALLLRRAGLNAVYLGADTPVEDLLKMTRELAPAAVFLSVSLAESAAELRLHQPQLRDMEPLLVLGGRAIDVDPDLIRETGGLFFGNDVRTVITEVAALLEKRSDP